MQEENVKLKYIIGIYKDLPEYPSAEDIYYFIYNRSVSKARPVVGFNFTDNLIFSKMGNELDETRVSESLQDLVDKGIIALKKSTKTRTSYEVVKDLYVNES